MIDGKIAGTGNSRFLKSISTFLTQYPTYADFAAALVAGTLPIDLNGINTTGWSQEGTPLNKVTLLSDTTASRLKLSGDPTVNDALSALAVSTATVTLSTANWVGTAAPYTQTIAVSGLLSTDKVVTSFAEGATVAAEAEANKCSVKATAMADGSITFSARKSKPSVAIPVNLLIVR